MRTSRRRLTSIAIVIATSTVAIAIAAQVPSGSVTVTPRIRVIKHANGTSGSGSVILANTSPTPVDIGSITYNCGAPPAMQLMGGSGGTPFTLTAMGTAMSTKALAIECPSGLLPGMQRCTFTVKDSMNAPVLDFLGVCETDGMPLLQRTVSMLSFGDVTVGSTSPPMTVSITNTSGAMSVPSLQLQVDDDSFLIGSPCQNETGCDAPVAILPGGSAPVDVLCKPTSNGPKIGHLFVIGSNGFFLQLPVDLMCNGAPGTGPVLTLTPASINLTNPIEVIDPATDQATVQLKNAGTGTLTITSLQITDNGVSGAGADWTFGTSGQCPIVPCTLATNDVLNVDLVFNPSNFNSRPGKLIVNFTDPGIKQATVTLDGSGQGATVQLVGTSTTLDFGVVPLTVTSAPQTFTLTNSGNRATTATLTASPTAPFTFPSSIVVNPGVNPTVSVTCQSTAEVLVTNRVLMVTAADANPSTVVLTLKCDVRNTQLISSPASLPL